MVLTIVLNLYVTVEMVLKQLISSFDTSLALVFKGKPSSTKSPVSTTRFSQKIKTALFILLLVKAKCRFPWLSLISVMRYHIETSPRPINQSIETSPRSINGLLPERVNESCFYARTKKSKAKEIKIVKRNSKITRIANSI